ncbi:ATPase [Streptomyces avermitilis]|uniref:Simple sugar ABC transporter permease protein n=2 Tax=Streptomyces avermitilis TaxID=33903 RepID=Q82PF2_STRAW|nr:MULTISPECIES: ABC transporter permease [Streptomyces]KUN46983.1 ATPase [Streptomyces avermitilis]MYS96606.1 ABC transporter permease [Streptomyces sp. SID5469]BAC68679.1 putative simple sugar ABC transporter permease protein [Streptomyces avermitilis MA-4680 = NBRC 14893]BBJ48589.1 sugar ABC transporter permease [Streptomyces avermitilis]GDY60631.1 sugar ABC transporter permease [Streptomyces avermitilis]
MADVALRNALPADRAAAVRWLQEYGVYAGVVVLLLFNVAFTDHFLSAANFRTQAVQVAPVLVVALGMALAIGTEGIDLSVGSVMALSTSLLSLYLGYGPWVALLTVVVGGVVIGLANGTLIAFVGVQPIVATLALMVGTRGLALVMLPQLKDVRDPTLLSLGSGDVVGVPYLVLIAAALAVVVAFVVRRTTFGRQLLAIGDSRPAAQLAGLPVRRVLITVYVCSGVLAAVAGFLSTARLSASDPTSLGQLMELSAITAVVVGGTPLTGGRVRVGGTVAGALLIQLLTATLIKHDLSPSWTQLAQAVVIILAVYAARERGKR